jgi:hypothetical protein
MFAQTFLAGALVVLCLAYVTRAAWPRKGGKGGCHCSGCEHASKPGTVVASKACHPDAGAVQPMVFTPMQAQNRKE